MRRLLNLFCLLLLITGCSTPEQDLSTDNRYARGFSIINADGLRKLTVVNPWTKARNVVFEYYLVDKSSVVPPGLSGKNIIRTPVDNIICLSTTHIAFLEKLDELDKLTGISGGIYVSNQTVIEGIENQKIVDVGYGHNLNYEEIINRKPDVVMVYGIDTEITGMLNKFKDLGIPAIINAEYLETSPLGKAEWIKFVGALFNKERMADSIFASIEGKYLELKGKIPGNNKKPKVMFGLPYRDAWWVPGGKSYLAELVSDAGGEYIGKKNRSRESYVISFEEALLWADKADYWLHVGMVNSKEEILAVDSRFSKFKVFNNGLIYNNNKRSTGFGGNDFWESGVVAPEIILADLIRIFHPEAIGDSVELFYYHEIR